MKKLIAIVIGILAATSAFAIRENTGPAITGSTPNGSWVDVRVTANVVEGIAVNEASPIDFGNLVKDNAASGNNKLYQTGEKIRENTPGRVTYRANTIGYNTFKTYLETDRIDLTWISDSGVEDNVSRNKYIRNVKIEGIGTSKEDIILNNGHAERKLTAWFVAYDKKPAAKGDNSTQIDYVDGNLGEQQKLGNYEGTVKVVAESIKKIK